MVTRIILWLLSVLLLAACASDEFYSDCPFHRFTFTLDVQHNLSQEYIRLQDSLVLELSFSDELRAKENDELINLENIPLKMGLGFKRFDESVRYSLHSLEDAKQAFGIRVLAGDSLVFQEDYRLDSYSRLKADNSIIVRPEKTDGLNKVKIILRPKEIGVFLLFWRIPNSITELYAINLLYDEGCDERVNLNFRNPTVNNVEKYAPEDNQYWDEKSQTSWINEEGVIMFEVRRF